jgi:hypothetical protein
VHEMHQISCSSHSNTDMVMQQLPDWSCTSQQVPYFPTLSKVIKGYSVLANGGLWTQLRPVTLIVNPVTYSVFPALNSELPWYPTLNTIFQINVHGQL